MKDRNNVIIMVFLALVCLGLLPGAKALSPPPDGGYAGFNTAEGTNALKNLTTGVGNSAAGWYSLWSNTDGSYNTAVGAGTLVLNLGNQSTSEGIENTAVGAAALLLNTTGRLNTAVGAFVLENNTEGLGNTATGSFALNSNTIGILNTAIGESALRSNVDGFENTAIGDSALYYNTEGSLNTAVGESALYSNTSGDSNTAMGDNALYFNETGGSNTAIGESALYSNIHGNANAAVGQDALFSNETGFGNVAVGAEALFSNETDGNTAVGEETLYLNTQGMSNTAVGLAALINNSTGSYNTALGANAGLHLTTGDNNIDIGYNVQGVAGESNTIRIGDNLDNTAGASKCYIGGILNQTVSPGTAVYIGSAGRLGTVQSSKRFKEDISPMNNASEVIFQFNPVTFRYKKAIDPAGTPQFGLVAEEVEKVNPDLVIRDQQGRPQTVRYEQINAMLLNEFLKAHRKIEDQERKGNQQDITVTELRSQVQALTAALKEQAAQIQKVSAKIQQGLPRKASQLVASEP